MILALDDDVPDVGRRRDPGPRGRPRPVDDPPRERALTADGATARPLIPAGLDATLVLRPPRRVDVHRRGPLPGPGRDAALADRACARPSSPRARLARPARRRPRCRSRPAPPLEIVHSPLGADRGRRPRRSPARWPTSRRSAGRSRPGPIRASSRSARASGRASTATRSRRAGATSLATWRRRPLEAWAPGGESLPEVQARVRPALGRAPRRASPRAGVAGHARPAAGRRLPRRRRRRTRGRSSSATTASSRSLLLTLFDLPLDRFWMWSFDLCGISVIEFRGGRPVLRAHNLTEHLAPLLDEAARADDRRAAAVGRALAVRRRLASRRAA